MGKARDMKRRNRKLATFREKYGWIIPAKRSR